MKRLFVFCVFAVMLIAGAASAQPAPVGPSQEQIAFLSKALGALQQQRNAAQDEAANAQAVSAMLREQIAGLQEQIARLKAQLEQKEPPK